MFPSQSQEDTVRLHKSLPRLPHQVARFRVCREVETQSRHISGGQAVTSELENKLLKSAYEQLGLTLCFSPYCGYVVYDSDTNEYACFMEGGIEPSPSAPASGEGFLRVSYFEHYGFPGSYKVIHNQFHGMSHEELELRLTVAGRI